MGDTYSLVNVDRRIQFLYGKYREFQSTAIGTDLASDLQHARLREIDVAFKTPATQQK